MDISVLGAGTFGCALAEHLRRNGHKIKLWGRAGKSIEQIILYRKMPKALGNKVISEDIYVCSEIEEAVKNTQVLVFAIPSMAVRDVARKIKEFYKNQIILIATKGIEEKTNFTIDEVIKNEIQCEENIAVISGPTHAEEIVENMPTVCVVASKNNKIAVDLQNMFMSDTFRVYTSDDVKGVEMGGAIKNVLAIAAGISDGIGYGDNAKAALITRSIVEFSNLGKSLGAKAETFNGLAGLGDLIVTCQSIHSRNRMCGYFIGKGYNLEEAVKKVGMVVEGVNALKSIYNLAKNNGVDTPIIDAIYDIIYEGVEIDKVIKGLIKREPKRE